MPSTPSPLHVAVTSANGLVGRMVLPELQARGHRVTALVRAPATLPADETIPDWTTSAAAMRALEAADAIIHLSGESQARNWQSYHASNVQTTERVAQALASGRARRVAFVSYPNASPPAANDFLRAKGMAEQLLAGSGKEAVIFRVQVIVNTPQEPGPVEQALIAPPRGRVQTLGRGDQPVFPVFRRDVAAALVRAVEGGRPGTYDLASPEPFTMDSLIQMLNRSPDIAIRHTPQWLARLLSRFVPELPPAFVDLYFQTYPPMDGARASQTFGLTLTPLRPVWG